MAVHWVDPYLNTTTGGIHGTTTSGQSSGTGSYSTPWSLTELNDTTNYSGWSDGDEVRFKGLTEDTFFPPANSVTFKQSNGTTDYSIRTDYNGYYQPNIYQTNGDNNKLIKIKQKDRGTTTGTTFFYKHHGNYNDSIRTVDDANTWYPALPVVDVANGYIPLDDRYQITVAMNGGSTGQFLRYLTGRVKITAGWTSETTQNGITVLDANSTSIFGSGCYWGTAEDSTYKGPIFDCENTLVLSRYRSSSNWYMYGSSIKFLALCDAGQNYSDWQFYSGSLNTGTSFSTMPSGFVVGEYSILKIVGTHFKFHINADRRSFYRNEKPIAHFPFIAYYGANHYFIINNTTGAEVRLKEVYTYSPFDLYWNSDYYFILNLLDGWNLETYDTSVVSRIGYGAPSTSKRNFSEAAIVGTQGDSYHDLGNYTFTEDWVFSLYSFTSYQWGMLPNTENNFEDYTQKLVSSDNMFEKTLLDQKVYSAAWINSLDTKGVDLKDITVSPISFADAVGYPWAQKVFVRNESGSMLPVTCLSPTTAGSAAMIYNSPRFSYNKSIRFFPTNNGKTYVDVVAYDMPTFSSNVDFSATYTTTTSPGVNVTNKLYLYDKSTKIMTQITSINGSVNGTTITCNHTMTTSDLANKAGLLIVIHEYYKTSADVGEISYTSITVT